MMTALESQVSRALMRLRLIERALHDQDGWGIHCEGVIALATVEVDESTVRIIATLPGLCSIGDDLPIVDITKDGEFIWTTRLDGPLGESGTDVTVGFALGDLVSE